MALLCVLAVWLLTNEIETQDHTIDLFTGGRQGVRVSSSYHGLPLPTAAARSIMFLLHPPDDAGEGSNDESRATD